MKKSNLKKLNLIVTKSGEYAAMRKVAEECMELALAIEQYYCPTKNNKKKRLDEIHKEMADVEVAMRGMKMLSIIKPKKVNRYANNKLISRFNKLFKNETDTKTTTEKKDNKSG